MVVSNNKNVKINLDEACESYLSRLLFIFFIDVTNGLMVSLVHVLLHCATVACLVTAVLVWTHRLDLSGIMVIFQVAGQ